MKVTTPAGLDEVDAATWELVFRAGYLSISHPSSNDTDNSIRRFQWPAAWDSGVDEALKRMRGGR